MRALFLFSAAAAICYNNNIRISKECDLTMNEQEWQACVNHVAGGEYPVPAV